MYTSESDTDTEALAERLATQFRGGEVVELVSDVGGGKTTFVRGLARGIRSNDNVASPTFTLSRQYQGERLTMYHYDLYRLDAPSIVVHEFDEQALHQNVVRVVEWGQALADVLPNERITIRFRITADTARQITVTAPKRLEYIIREVT